MPVAAVLAIEMLIAVKNRLRATRSEAVRQRVQNHIRWLEQELAGLGKDLDHTIRESPLWREKDNLLRSLPGVRPGVFITLLADLPELGTLRAAIGLSLWQASLPTAVTAADSGANG